jgi:bifunctional non-homologous end joining protein LigD
LKTTTPGGRGRTLDFGEPTLIAEIEFRGWIMKEPASCVLKGLGEVEDNATIFDLSDGLP